MFVGLAAASRFDAQETYTELGATDAAVDAALIRLAAIWNDPQALDNDFDQAATARKQEIVTDIDRQLVGGGSPAFDHERPSPVRDARSLDPRAHPSQRATAASEELNAETWRARQLSIDEVVFSSTFNRVSPRTLSEIRQNHPPVPREDTSSAQSNHSGGGAPVERGFTYLEVEIIAVYW